MNFPFTLIRIFFSLSITLSLTPLKVKFPSLSLPLNFVGLMSCQKKKWKFFCTNFWGTKEGVYNILIQHLLPYIWVTTYTFNLNLKIHERTMTWGKLGSHLLAAVLKKFLVLCIWVRNVNLPSHLSTRYSVECSHRPWHF